jgi:hypothetical protein
MGNNRIRRLAVLTGGGDCPGLNAVIRAVVKTAIREYGLSVIGFENGFGGLIQNRSRELKERDVSGIVARGGTILGTTNRDNPFHYPREVELALEEHPLVAEAAVIGLPHPVKGQIIKAFIIPVEGHEPDKQELFHFLRTRLTSYKIPEIFAFMDELPRSASGKILKRLLD